MLKAIFTLRCPRCHTGKLFIDSNAYHLRSLDKMPDHCSACGQPFQPEPGFFFGAMYVSYGLCVGLFLVWFAITEWFIPMSAFWFLGLYIVTLLLLWPVVFRYSRTIYFYLFVRYDANAITKWQK